MLYLFVGCLIGAAVMWIIAAQRQISKLKKESEQLRTVKALARDVFSLADQLPWDPAATEFWHAMDLLHEELDREQ